MLTNNPLQLKTGPRSNPFIVAIFLEISNSGYLSVYSRGPAHDFQIDKLGVYKRTNETKNGKPTWRKNQTGHSIFYHGRKF